MKKINLAFITLSFMLANCSKISNSNYACYEGIYIKHDGVCPDLIKITKSLDPDITPDTKIEFNGINLDSLVDGEKLKFKIIDYQIDTTFYTTQCIWSGQIAKIELCNPNGL